MKSHGLEKALLVLILTVSLLLRLAALDIFLTVDEPGWRSRSRNFYDALAQRKLEATYQSEHPGVVPMWIGTAAIWIMDRIEGGDARTELGRWLHDALCLPCQDEFPAITFWARRIVALVTWFGTLILYTLLRRTYGGPTALIATALVALDPFYLAHSRVHHLDALLTTFTMLSVASFAAYQRYSVRWRYLFLSGLSGGLAIATKSPGVLLIVWVLLVLGIDACRAEAPDRKRVTLRAAKTIFCWAMIAGGVVIVIWPALWVDPLGTIEKVVAGALREGLNPHLLGNFFWFDVRADPGPGFYPVAWAFRTTPWVMGGLIALVIAGRVRVPARRIMALLLFILVWGAFMTISSKKFDRYLLPTFPLFCILAALGYVSMLARLQSLAGWRRVAPSFLTTVIALTQFVLIWPTHPYYLAYYNPLVGGTRVAPRVLLIGWGEGLDKAARYLSRKPNAEDLLVAVSQYRDAFTPFFVGRTTIAGRTHVVVPDYYVFYSSHVQRKLVPGILRHFYGVESPEYVASVNGMEYAWIYPNTFYRDEALKILNHIESQSGSEGDLVLLNARAAFLRNYQGRLSFSVIEGPSRDDFVLNSLERALSGPDRAWFLSFPSASGDVTELVRGHLETRAKRGEAITIRGVTAVCYELGEGVCFACPTPAVRRNFAWGIESAC